ncbi:hypothetical protein AWQ21_08180 [Picosynechococcus sp. PCC 7003]|uniref:DUF29 domain-containing protein n=1 Tax=Picosynechococcus sp. PCC 7003 TaxID=374981 RepID=UPI0008105615|nr:DUF29 domain-containing protein [Picosynechococcus sp. PCC 7003]ANV84361.1 hypothetical protein AWQ21_08180 [Picosynechococcus sp. PCC 7003]
MEKALYDRDFLVWIEKTVEELKAQNFAALDLEHLIDEVESLGKREKRELKSRLITLFEHLLKRHYVPMPECYRGWDVTIRRTQSKLKDLLADSPSLSHLLEEIYLDCYQEAIANMQLEYDVKFPQDYPFLSPPQNLLN